MWWSSNFGLRPSLAARLIAAVPDKLKELGHDARRGEHPSPRTLARHIERHLIAVATTRPTLNPRLANAPAIRS